MKPCWQRLIRFQACDGRVLKGEPIFPDPQYVLGKSADNDGLRAKVIVGANIFDESGQTHISEEIVSVQRLLSPLAAHEVPILRCIGLNYIKHSTWRCLRQLINNAHISAVKEVPGREPPPYPSIFFSPNTTINDPEAVIYIPKICQDDQADYEGELVSSSSPYYAGLAIDKAPSAL